MPLSLCPPLGNHPASPARTDSPTSSRRRRTGGPHPITRRCPRLPRAVGRHTFVARTPACGLERRVRDEARAEPCATWNPDLSDRAPFDRVSILPDFRSLDRVKRKPRSPFPKRLDVDRPLAKVITQSSLELDILPSDWQRGVLIQEHIWPTLPDLEHRRETGDLSGSTQHFLLRRGERPNRRATRHRRDHEIIFIMRPIDTAAWRIRHGISTELLRVGLRPRNSHEDEKLLAQTAPLKFGEEGRSDRPGELHE